MPTLFITGANRGIGLGVARMLAEKGWDIHATCRTLAQSEPLQALARSSAGCVTIHTLELLDFAAIRRLGETLRNETIDVLFNNAGVMNMAKERYDPASNNQDFGHTEVSDWTQVFQVNVIAPMKLAEALIEPIARSERKTIITATSVMGSIRLNTTGRWYHYRTAKAAVNQMMRGMSAELRPRGIICFPLHPGSVRTDMNFASAPLSVDESAAGIVRVIEGASMKNSGRNMMWNGEEMAW